MHLSHRLSVVVSNDTLHTEPSTEINKSLDHGMMVRSSRCLLLFYSIGLPEVVSSDTVKTELSAEINEGLTQSKM